MGIKKVTPVYDKIANAKAKTVINVGGARSSKSYSLAQLVIYFLSKGLLEVSPGEFIPNEKITIGICRKTFPSLRMTAYKQTIDLLKEYGMYSDNRHNKTFHTFNYGNALIQ